MPRRQLVYMEWTDERVFALIERYEKSECLYNVKLKSYHNRNVKKNVLENMAAEFKTTGSYNVLL